MRFVSNSLEIKCVHAHACVCVKVKYTNMYHTKYTNFLMSYSNNQIITHTVSITSCCICLVMFTCFGYMSHSSGTCCSSDGNKVPHLSSEPFLDTQGTMLRTWWWFTSKWKFSVSFLPCFASNNASVVRYGSTWNGTPMTLNLHDTFTHFRVVYTATH